MRANRTRGTTIALLMLAAAGCSRTTLPLAPGADEPPAASSPIGAVERLAWALEHTDVDVAGGLLTEDFLYIGAGTDSAGNLARVLLPDRTWFLDSLAALRDSGAAVRFVLDRNLVSFPDSRPGKDPKWHRQVRSSVDWKVRIGSSTTREVAGGALFFLTRGDSAAIPQELVNRGIKPDSARWRIDRWEDETLIGPYALTPGRGLPLTGQLEHFRPRLAR